MRIDVSIDGRHVHKALAKLQAHGHSQADLLHALAEQAVTQNEERHRKEIDPNGHPWEPLKPSTRRAKNQQRMLFETGSMLRLHVRKMGSVVQVGTADEKAAWHHFGTQAYTIVAKKQKALANTIAGVVFGKRINHPGLPARPMLGINKSDMREMGENLVGLLKREIGG